MMLQNNIYVFCGLPGSGKTFSARNKYRDVGGIFLDDDFSIEEYQSALVLKTNIFITDSNLCKAVQRDSFISFTIEYSKKHNLGEPSFHWTFFENDYEKSYNNVVFRCDGRTISQDDLKAFSQQYMIPSEISAKNIKSIWLAPVS